jgi:hypothetical protein
MVRPFGPPVHPTRYGLLHAGENVRDFNTVDGNVSIESPSTTAKSPASKGGGKPGQSGPPGNSNATKHGLKLLKGKVRELGVRAIDARTRLGRTLADLREAITSDLGGKDQLNQAQLILIDDVARLTLWIDSVDGWLLTLPSVVNKKKRTLVPVIKERTGLVETRARLLQALGLERRAKLLPTLAEYLAGKSEPVSQAKDELPATETVAAPTDPPEGDRP